MKLELNTDYIKTYMKEIQDTVGELSKDETDMMRNSWLRSVKHKAQFVINYIDGVELELDKELDMFRDANDIKEEICINQVK